MDSEFSLPFMGRVAEPEGRGRVGALRQIKRRAQYRHALPTRSLRDHPPHEGEGEALQSFIRSRPIRTASAAVVASADPTSAPHATAASSAASPPGAMA